MRVSILIPCYNAQRWVAQAIQSALDQTWPDTEVIVLDDGSTDNSLDVIRSFGNRIRLESTPNRGGNAARNHLLQLASGDWLQYLDADDYLLPDKIERQLAAAASAPRGNAPPDVIYSPRIFLNDQTALSNLVAIEPTLDATVHFIQWRPFQTTALLLQKSAIVAVGGWAPDQPCCQEHELLLRLLIAGYDFAFCAGGRSIYRFHGQDTTSRRNPLRVTSQRMLLTDRLEQHLLFRGPLTIPARRALCISRLEAARSVYQTDANYARELYARAALTVGSFFPASPAAPLPYRIALALLGFDAAERLAAIRRPFFRRHRGPTVLTSLTSRSS